MVDEYVHNFKATVNWLTDELFQRHDRGTPKPQRSALQRIGDAAAVGVVISGGLLFWRAAQPTSFNQTLRSTELPALLDRLQPD